MHRVFMGVMTIIFAMSAIAARGAEGPIVLGVLEDTSDAEAGQPESHAVRVIFQKNGETWVAFPNNCPDETCLKSISQKYPPEMTWTVTFDGRELGQITGKTPDEFKFYSSVGLQTVTNASVPTVGKRSTEYGGFIGSPVYRPLVVNSEPYFKDPESWKPAQPSADALKALRLAFRQEFSKQSNCTNPKDKDIKITKAYSSTKGWSVARLEHLCSGVAYLCGWFAVSPELQTSYLDDGMWLVDAGDYDNSGKSQLVFAINQYNRGGYEIFYDNFKKHTLFEFSYH